jgi:predicted PurR-regulated permease PerM
MVDSSHLRTTVRDTLRELAVGWWLFAGVLAVVLAFVGWVFLPWIVFGVFIYYVSRPIAQRLRGRIDNPTLTALVTLLLIVGPILSVFAGLIIVALGQLAVFVSGEAFTTMVESLQLDVAGGSLPTDPVGIAMAAVDLYQTTSVRGLFTSVSRTLGTTAATTFNLSLSLLFAFFLLAYDGRLVGWFHTTLASDDSEVSRYLAAVDRGLGSIYFGYTLTIFVIILLTGVLYNLFNLVAPPGLEIPLTILLAVLTGLFTIVPLLGRSIVYAVIVLYLSVIALRTDPRTLWFPVGFLLVMTLLFDQSVRAYIRPKLSGQQFEMAFVMFAYLLGPALFGWWGIFFGPFLMVVIVRFVRLELPRLLHDGRATAGGDEVDSEAAVGNAAAGDETGSGSVNGDEDDEPADSNDQSDESTDSDGRS